MKLAKLSLAAILAAGAFSVANATSLENAIKGVSLNGMLRIRFYNESAKSTNDYNRWRTSGIFSLGIPVGDNLKMVYRVSSETNVYADDDTLNPNGKTSVVDSTVTDNLFYLQYSNGPVNAIAGKIPVYTPITSSDPVGLAHGAGAIASYNVGNGFTVAGAYIDALVANETISGTDEDGTGYTTGPKTATNPYGLDLTPSNTSFGNTIYAAAVMYKNDMVNAQAWYFHAVNILKNVYTLQATVTPVDGLSIHGDYASSKLDIDGAENKAFYNISAKYAANGFCAKLGYAATNKKAGVISLGSDAPIGAVITAANRYNISNMTDTDAIYGKIGYNVNEKTKVYAQYATVDDGTIANNDSDEYAVGASYKYNKKLSFATYYDVLDWSSSAEANGNVDNNEFRFEAKYSF